MDEGLNDAHAGLENLDSRNDYLENMSRRNNIKVFGIEEAENESWDDCETKVKKAISEKLGIKDEILIERAYRVGKRGGDRRRPARARGRVARTHADDDNKPRPIVAKFLNWKQKSAIIKEATKKRPKDVCFREDFSQKILDTRAALIPQLIEARKEGKTAFLKMDKLVILKGQIKTNAIFLYS